MNAITAAWIAAIVFSVIGWGSLVHFAMITRKWPKVRGRVVGNISEFSNSGASETGGRSVVHFPEIEFPANGATHVSKGSIGKVEPWVAGETVELHYKPSNPDHVLDFNLAQRLLFSGVFIAFGLVSLVAALGWIR